MANKIVRSGMQVYCDRKNFRREEGSLKADAISDPAHVTFYEKFEAYQQKSEAEGKKSRPMFRLEVLHPDENGDIKSKTVEYSLLCPEQIGIALKFAESFGPLNPTRGRQKKKATEAGEATEATESGEPKAVEAPQVVEAPQAAAAE